MKQRLLTAAVALPLLIFSIVMPWLFPNFEQASWLFVLFVAAAIVAGLFEFFSLTKKQELKADASIAFMFAGLYFLAFLFDAPAKAPELLSITTVVFLIVLFISQTFRFREDFSKMLPGTAVTLIGVLWIAFMGGYLVSIRLGFEFSVIPHLSSKLLLFFFMVTMGSDVGAYFIGKQFGKRKLVPKISPNKTWEGLIGGLVLAVGFAALTTFMFLPELPYQVSIPFAIVMALVGVGGDLTESAIKRGAGIKDAAKVLPGHGGLLDRLDSLLFNAPIMFYFSLYYFG